MEGDLDPSSWYSTNGVGYVDNSFTQVVDGTGLVTVGEAKGLISGATRANGLPNIAKTFQVTTELTNTVKKSPFNHSGAFFTGLSKQDVLVINAVWYIERFPTVEQTDLMLLSYPTPPIDRVALDVYSYLAGVMPVGMYQRANGFGDWFKDAVNVVTDIVAPMASVLPGPVGAVGKAVTAGGGIAKKFFGAKPESAPANERPTIREEVRISEPSGTLTIRAKNPKKKKKSLTSLLQKVSLAKSGKGSQIKKKKKH